MFSKTNKSDGTGWDGCMDGYGCWLGIAGKQVTNAWEWMGGQKHGEAYHEIRYLRDESNDGQK